MEKLKYTLILALAVCACRHPEVELVNLDTFETFKVISVKSGDYFEEDGSLNPDVHIMEDFSLDAEPDTKVARTDVASMARDLIGVFKGDKLLHIAGIYQGHDVDGSPLEQSGKLIVPASGPVKNLILVSHYTIGANFECPSETFPLEGIFASKGYAVAIADYIGYGVTADRIHPYMHTESTARSVVDMGIAVRPFLEHIGRKPESDEVILFGYSQGGSTTLAVMDMLQDEYPAEFPLKMVYAGAGPYDLAATYDTAMEQGDTGIPCAIPMIVQGVNVGENLGLEMSNFFKPKLLEGYDDWINSKAYTVGQINQHIGSRHIQEIMTDEGRDKNSAETARLYAALLANSVLNFTPRAPIYLFHSNEDGTVPFVNGQRAEQFFKGHDLKVDFGKYGTHQKGCIRFIFTAYKDLP